MLYNIIIIIIIYYNIITIIIITYNNMNQNKI